MRDASKEQETIAQLAEHYKAIIELLGEDTAREGLEKTPMRAAKAMYYCTRGYGQDINAVLNGALFNSDSTELVVVRDIEFYSLCEHHILPFFGHVSVGYVPGGRIVGLSKLARIVDMYARRLQVQENFTSQLCRALYDALGAKGVIVACRASHLCMRMRGVAKQDSITVTSAAEGILCTDSLLREQFYNLLK